MAPKIKFHCSKDETEDDVKRSATTSPAPSPRGPDEKCAPTEVPRNVPTMTALRPGRPDVKAAKAWT